MPIALNTSCMTDLDDRAGFAASDVIDGEHSELVGDPGTEAGQCRVLCPAVHGPLQPRACRTDGRQSHGEWLTDGTENY